MKEKVFYSNEAKHYEGIGIRENGSCIVILTNYNLKFCDTSRRPIKEISLKDITNVAVISDKELVSKDKSVIARGLVGGVLFGGVGLFLGGLSGTGSKQKMQDINYLIVNYIENGEDKVISVYGKYTVITESFIKTVEKFVTLSKDSKCIHCGKEVNIAAVKCPHCGKLVREIHKGSKVILGIVIGIIAFFILLIIIVSSLSGGNSKEVNMIKRVVSVEEVKAENIDAILDSVGLDKFENIKADSEGLDGFEGEGSKGYRIKTDFSDNVILYLDKDNNVICIRYADKDYYRNGNVLQNFNNNK